MSGLFTNSCLSTNTALEKVEQTFKLTISPVRTVVFSFIQQNFCCFLRYHVSPWRSCYKGGTELESYARSLPRKPSRVLPAGGFSQERKASDALRSMSSL